MKDLDGLPMPQRLGAIIAIALGVTMAVLDGMIANVALPTIADDLGTSAANSIWIVNAYQLVITMSLLSLASFGDLWSYRKVYLIGLGVFASMSVLCALSDSLLTLTIARMLQGLGAAAVMSVNGALTRLIYPSRILARGIAINTLIVAVSAAAGPTVAAGVLSIASWPWLFAINVPIGLLALIMGYRFLPANAGVREQRFDKLSGLLNAITFGLFFAALTGFAQGHDWATAGADDSRRLVLCAPAVGSALSIAANRSVADSGVLAIHWHLGLFLCRADARHGLHSVLLSKDPGSE